MSRGLAPFLLVSALALGCGGDAPPSSGGVSTHVQDWRDEVIYQLVVDRFDNAEPDNDVVDGVQTIVGDLRRHQGGDWKGVIRRLDYIRRLGGTALWISPVVDNVQRTDAEDGYHGYWAKDFTRPNPRYGDMGDLRELVDEAHARDMLVIVDVVVNHAGRVFAYDLDADGEIDDGELEPPYSFDGPHEAPLLWITEPPRVFDGMDAVPLTETSFHRRGFGDLSDPEQKELGDFPTGLRDLATTDSAVVDRLVDTWVWWVEQTDVDGFRLDAVPHVEEAFWPVFSARLRERLAAIGKHRFLLLGEVFTTSPEVLGRYLVDDALDAVFDFPLKWGVIDAYVLEGRAPADVALPALRDQRAFYPERPQPMGVGLTTWEARVAFADNHDTWRLRAELDDPLAAELAMTVVFTVDAIPTIYYGTEQELDGDVHHEHREPLWPTGFREDTRMFLHLSRLAELRRAHAALRYGSLEILYASEHGGRADEDDAGLLAWERAHDGQRAVIAINSHSTRASEATFETGFAPGSRVEDVLWRTVGAQTVGEGGAIALRIPPRSAVVMIAR